MDPAGPVFAALGRAHSGAKMSKYEIKGLGGYCPVQADGRVDGVPFYFRARGNAWSMSVGQKPILSPEWFYKEQYGERPYEAGWMPLDVAKDMISKAVELYLSEKAAGGLASDGGNHFVEVAIDIPSNRQED